MVDGVGSVTWSRDISMCEAFRVAARVLTSSDRT